MKTEEERHNRIQSKMNTDIEYEAIRLGAEILERKGYNCYGKIINKHAETLKDIKGKSDCGDILIIKSGAIGVVEVKRLSENNINAGFMSRDTWSSPNFIVDGVRQYDSKKPKPYLYMCFNSKLSAVVLCYSRTREWWGKETKAGNESTKEYYVASLDDVKFYTTAELLRSK